MIPLTPALLVGTASAFIGVAAESRRENDQYEDGTLVDQLVKRARRRRGRRGLTAPWDAAFVQHAGHRSHLDHRVNKSSWPIPARCGAHAHELADFARQANILDPRPEIGDLFVLWCDGRQRFTHSGIVLQVGSPGEFPSGQAFVECVVLSPNVFSDGRVGGPSVLRLTRRISPDRGDAFIRWTELGSVDAARPHDEGDGADTEPGAEYGLREAA